ncbi:PilZ domain protein [bacterium BMS3Abin07]|nr:PilZ domain protein [bacterium BMS3Abin07]GBE33092.1 PilZ domain protein [bacterium BMS3Bbin05]HDL20728.1 hypothetical protein [Nitrospirota bacterium]HDO21771.1 hypothetical protein [Nitrospirota bacterium]HDZ87586.1 hypothetical protein [Nitrospirota bacterium]
MARINKRGHKRYTRRLKVVFKDAERTYTSFSSDISNSGLFIRTNRAFAPGSIINIELYLPDDSIAYLKGKVKRAEKTALNVIKNGMGVKLLEVDGKFRRFLKKEFSEEDEKGTGRYSVPQPGNEAEEFILLRCDSCNAKNKIKKSMLDLGLKCGRCGKALHP